VVDSQGNIAGEIERTIELPAKDSQNVELQVEINAPQLWSLESPSLYTAEVELSVDGKQKDKLVTPFGIRTIEISAEKGFLLNGKMIKLKGGCIHHDNGILGAAAIDRAEERKIELLKANGFNAIRCSHNPPSEKLLEACDRLGMLVIDEPFDHWQEAKNPDDYHRYFDEWWERDFSSMILRDRNHPSIILWSIGNEIEERADPAGLEITKKLKAKAKELDPTRMITEAINEFWDHPGRPWAMTAPAFELLDVGGYNYQWWEYENDHAKFPNRIMLGTESVPKHAFQNWDLVEKHPYIIGDFVWTAMDYLGESGIGHTVYDTGKIPQLRPWPWFNGYCGDIDLIGIKKPQSYYRDVVWRRSKIEMAVHAPYPNKNPEQVSYWGWPDEEQSWTWPGNEGKKMEVNVYSRSPLVRLLLNGKTIAEKEPDSLLTAKFELLYAPGELKAVAIEDGEEAGSVILTTSGKPKSIRLVADRKTINANRNDLAYVTVEVIDENGHVVPDATIPVQFVITGQGELAGVGNANPADMASFKQPRRKTFRGRCLVILRPRGKAGSISLEASAAGLEKARITITTK
jgi:beta-galactosidase